MLFRLTRELPAATLYVLSAAIGVAAFTYPFLAPALGAGEGGAFVANSAAAPLLTVVLLVLCLFVMLLEVQGQAISAKVLAAMGVLVAATATLRFLEVAIPGPAGFSPIFAPIILAGFVFGPRFGFLMGALTLFVSALLTGGVGPWLPYQMFAAGWVGLTAGWLPHPQQRRVTLLLLVGFGATWGILYGMLMNLYFWPFMTGNGSLAWEQGAGLRANVLRYLAFYGATSLVWDVARAAGNGLLIAVLGVATVDALTRFKDRFQFEVQRQ